MAKYMKIKKTHVTHYQGNANQKNNGCPSKGLKLASASEDAGVLLSAAII